MKFRKGERMRKQLLLQTISTNNQLTLIMCSGLNAAEKLARYEEAINQFTKNILETIENKKAVAATTTQKS